MFLGIEIGGTKLQLGLGPGDGRLVALWRGSVNVALGPEGIRRQILEGVPELLRRASLSREQIHGVGIGFGGPVDDNTRKVIKSHQIEGWDDFSLADWITELLGWPATLGNDADCAGLAEALFGAGKDLSPIFYITVGSGIGGGLIIKGEIYRGSGRGAAEIGHLNVIGVGKTRIVEHMASGWAIGEEARDGIDREGDRSEAYRDSKKELVDLAGGKKKLITAKHVAQAAEQGNLFARQILDWAVNNLATGIVEMITLLCPRRIVIGGGVSLIGEELFFEPLRAKVKGRVFLPFQDCYDIVPAALGEEVVVHGALALARRKLSG